jgi:signal transduction histidine kinase
MADRDEERQWIGNDLYRTISQTLVETSRIADEARRAFPEVSGKLRRLDELLQKSVRDVHAVSHLLHPPMLDEAGLEKALSRYIEDYSERNSTKVDLEVSPNLGRLPASIELALFRLAEQALETVRQESPDLISRIKIALVSTSGEREVLLTVEGVAQQSPLRSHAPSFIDKVIPVGGIQSIEVASMRERVGRMGGRLRVDSFAGNAVVRAVLPTGRSR